jgi:hypothetical protein
MKEDKLMGHDPLSDADAILTEEYYGRRARVPGGLGSLGSPGDPIDGVGVRPRAANGQLKPTHYKVICISMYTRDIEELEAKAAELKRRGWTKASKSQLIRLALSQIDLDKLSTPRQ